MYVCAAVRSISGHKAAITCLDFHRYGDILGSGSMDTNVKVQGLMVHQSGFNVLWKSKAIHQ